MAKCITNRLNKIMKIDISSIFSQPDGNVSADLNLAGKIYSLVSFRTNIRQNVDQKGEPQGEARGAQLELSFSQMPDNAILQWSASRWMRKSGEIIFKNQTGTAPLKIIFTEAACVRFSQRVTQGAGVMSSFLISPKEVSFNGVLLSNGWRE